jgi:16S rRNA (uracil1498-N3)-methyltransferase
MRERRFLVDPADVESGRAIIRGSEHHHLSRVLRLGPGDEVCVFDGCGRGYQGRVESVDRGHAVVALGEPDDPRSESPVEVTLLQALLHGERMDWVVEKGTETGVTRIVPVLSERSVVRPKSGRWGRLDRWRRIALSAAKQSGRLVVPRIDEPVPFEQAVAGAGSPAVAAPGRSARLKILLHGGGAPLFEAAGGILADAADLLVGPEGGWTEGEVDRAAAAGWIQAGLGSRTLRADTAAVVGVSLLLLVQEEAARPPRA